MREAKQSTRSIVFVVAFAIVVFGGIFMYTKVIDDSDDNQGNARPTGYKGYNFAICVEGTSEALDGYTFSFVVAGVIPAKLTKVDSTLFCSEVMGSKLDFDWSRSSIVRILPDSNRELGSDVIEVCYLPTGFREAKLHSVTCTGVPFDEDSGSFPFQAIGVKGDVPFIAMEYVGSDSPSLVPTKVGQTTIKIEAQPDAGFTLYGSKR